MPSGIEITTGYSLDREKQPRGEPGVERHILRLEPAVEMHNQREQPRVDRHSYRVQHRVER